jgi:selenocysteine-specific elongation factor
MIVGTAGHIDHGKTSLVKAITGVDTDRLKEEKARGITIELGFAYWPRPAGAGEASGRIIGFVDVPGHERLVHTMLAGATGIDFVLLAVAADDGVMPQTREHLAIIDLLGLGRGVVALTKCDLADRARRAEVEAQIRAALAATRLAGAPILPVSTVTGEGLAALQAHLDAAAAGTAPRHCGGRFRLAVDRVFTLAGAGTVVTGTILSGAVAVGDDVLVSPAGLAARVRSIHAQGRRAEAARAGERAALALVGPAISTEAIVHGAVVLDSSLHAPVRRLDARLDLLASERRAIGQWVPVHLHHAAATVEARIVLLRDGALAPGTSDYVQLVLAAPLAAAVGDRFVLRDIAASRTIGGGTILDLAPPERRRRSAERRAELDALCLPDADRTLAALLGGPRGFLDIDAYVRDRALRADAADEACRRLGLAQIAAGRVRAAMLGDTHERFVAALLGHLAAHHAEHPDEPGLGQERLRLALAPRLPAPVFAAVLAALQREGRIRLDRAWVRLPGHEVSFSPEEEQLWTHIRPRLAGDGRFRPPRVRDIARADAIDEALVRRLMRLAARRGEVDEIARDHFFLAEVVIEMAGIARALAAAAPDGRFAVAAFRDKIGNGRKVAIQILEFFDAQGLTMRRGDIRRINPHKADLFTAPRAAA